MENPWTDEETVADAVETFKGADTEDEFEAKTVDK